MAPSLMIDGHMTGQQKLSHDDIPPFPKDLKEAPLVRISSKKLLANDEEESARIFSACQTYGFFYLDLTDSDEGRALLQYSEDLRSLAVEAFKIPQEEKNAVTMTKTGSVIGYKQSGIIALTDPLKRADAGEFWNISKNDMLTPETAKTIGSSGLPLPTLLSSQQPFFAAFHRAAHSLGLTVLDVLAVSLGIDPAELRSRHRLTAQSGDHTRLTYGPGLTASQAAARAADANGPHSLTTGPHTDFGSVTVLFNWVGGLQIAEPGSDGEFAWARPMPGCAIVNLGDAMVQYSGGRVRSGRHQVVEAPGEQAMVDRYSVVYFVRPEDAVMMEDLTVPEGERGKGEGKRYTTAEWIKLQAQNLGIVFKGDK